MDIAIVMPRNLPHKSQAKANAAFSFACPCRAIKWLEDPLAFLGGNARTPIAYRKLDCFTSTRQGHLDGGAATIAMGIVEQIADKPSQKPRLAEDRDWLYFERRIGRCAFLGSDRQQIDRVHLGHNFERFEAAGQQDLADKTVQFRNVVFELLLEPFIGMWLQHLDTHPQARKWRAQLMRSVGEKRFVG